jgi:chromosome segregation ATPase
MPRPTLDDEVVDRLTEVVDDRTKVPAEHLGIAERLDFILDELEEADSRAEYLSDRVETLEAELEEARREREETGLDGVLDDPTGGTGGLGANDRF